MVVLWLDWERLTWIHLDSAQLLRIRGMCPREYTAVTPVRWVGGSRPLDYNRISILAAAPPTGDVAPLIDPASWRAGPLRPPTER
jgi:hypothetical protein